MRVQAFQSYENQGPLVWGHLELPPLRPGEVRIRVTHCGVGHRDLHLIDGEWGETPFPLVPGHEAVGFVESVGKNVSTLKIGDRVGVGWLAGSCGKCEHCREENENLCPQAVPVCVGRPGGFATHLQVEEKFAFPIPETMRSEEAAPLMCAGLTVYAALRRFSYPGMRVGVLGIGGLGHIALQFASRMETEVIALSTDQRKEEESRRLGAQEHVLTTDENLVRNLQSSLDLLLVTAPADANWTELAKLLKPRGQMILVGTPPGSLQIDIKTLMSGEKSISSSFIGGTRMMREMLQFATRREVKPRIQKVPFGDLNESLSQLRAGHAHFCFVLERTS